MKTSKALILAFLFILFSNSFLFAQGTLFFCSRELPSGAWQVYRKDLTSLKIDTITHNPSYNYWWVEPSPDRKELLLLRSPYTSNTDQFDYDNCEMIKCRVDGKKERVLIADNQYNWFAFGNPHWHPNGDKILMIVQPDISSNPFFAITVDTAGTNIHLLTLQFTLDANWSPKGDKIVFVGLSATGTPPANFEIYTTDYLYAQDKIKNIRQLTNDLTRDHDPCFSPDGRSIVFSASDAGITDADLVRIDSSGANRTTILNDDGVHGGPVNWASDGKIYHHSIYLGKTGFMATAWNTNSNMQETLLSSISHGFLSPFFIPQTITNVTESQSHTRDLKVFVNSNQELEIQRAVSSKEEIEIYDVTGHAIIKTILEQNLERINISEFHPGLYFYRIGNAKGRFLNF